MALAKVMVGFSSSYSLAARFLNRSPSPATSALITHSFLSTHGGILDPKNPLQISRSEIPLQISRSGGTYSKNTSSRSFSSSPYPVADNNDLKEGEVEEKDIPKANGWSSSPYSVADSRTEEEKAKIARRYEALTRFPRKLCRFTLLLRHLSQGWLERRTSGPQPRDENGLYPFRYKRDQDSYIRLRPKRDQDCYNRLEQDPDRDCYNRLEQDPDRDCYIRLEQDPSK